MSPVAPPANESLKLTRARTAPPFVRDIFIGNRMDSPDAHTVSVQTASPRGIAAVRARLPRWRVPAAFVDYLDHVYAAGRAGVVRLDGQNVFVYRDVPNEEVELGVGAAPPAGPVHYAEPPAGEVATATHWGDYGRFGETRTAIVAWCRAHGRGLAGARREMYGHWRPEAGPPRTGVYYVLAS